MFPNGGKRLTSPADWQRIVSRLGIDQNARTQVRTLTSRAAYPDFDLPICAARSSSGGVAQRVLIAGVADGALICALNGIFGIFAKNLAAGRAGVPRQDIAIGLSRNVQLFQLLVSRNRRTSNPDPVDDNPVRKQHFQHVPVAGSASVLAAIADDKYDFAAASLA